MNMVLIIVFFTSFSLCFLLFKVPIRRLLDQSGDRSLHVGLIPRSGGLAIFISLFVCYGFGLAGIKSLIAEPVLMALLLLCSVSFLDDLKPLLPIFRLLVQLIVAAVIVWWGGLYFRVEAWPLVFQVITFLGLVWMINLYNFMDGMDGFASGMTVFGFSIFAGLGYLGKDFDFAWINLYVVVAVLGFWVWNFPPAKIFMGDTGSTLLGALASIMALSGVQRGVFPLWVPVIVFSPFWVDATYTLFARIKRGERFWQPHRSHFYQRLVLSGLSHKQVVLGEYVLMVACGLSVLLPPLVGVDYNRYPPIVWGGVYLLMIGLLEAYLADKPN